MAKKNEMKKGVKLANTDNDLTIDPEQQAVWEKCNMKIREVIDFICAHSKAPIKIEKSLFNEVNGNFKILSNFINNYFNRPPEVPFKKTRWDHKRYPICKKE